MPGCEGHLGVFISAAGHTSYLALFTPIYRLVVSGRSQAKDQRSVIKVVQGTGEAPLDYPQRMSTVHHLTDGRLSYWDPLIRQEKQAY